MLKEVESTSAISAHAGAKGQSIDKTFSGPFYPSKTMKNSLEKQLEKAIKKVKWSNKKTPERNLKMKYKDTGLNFDVNDTPKANENKFKNKNNWKKVKSAVKFDKNENFKDESIFINDSQEFQKVEENTVKISKKRIKEIVKEELNLRKMIRDVIKEFSGTGTSMVKKKKSTTAGATAKRDDAKSNFDRRQSTYQTADSEATTATTNYSNAKAAYTSHLASEPHKYQWTTGRGRASHTGTRIPRDADPGSGQTRSQWSTWESDRASKNTDMTNKLNTRNSKLSTRTQALSDKDTARTDWLDKIQALSRAEKAELQAKAQTFGFTGGAAGAFSGGMGGTLAPGKGGKGKGKGKKGKDDDRK